MYLLQDVSYLYIFYVAIIRIRKAYAFIPHFSRLFPAGAHSAPADPKIVLVPRDLCLYII